jgi:cell division cycle protein 20 (cofactor of APC complex)
MLMGSGRVGQSVMQTGEGVPRGVPKWTKRNHTAAVKVRIAAIG